MSDDAAPIDDEAATAVQKPRRRRRRWVIALVSLLVVVAAAWSAWSVWRVESALAGVRTDESDLNSALQRGDTSGASRLLTRLAAHSADAHDASDGPTWAVLGHLPVVGSDLRATANVSRVLDTLGDDGIQPLTGLTDAPDQLLPHDGRISPAALTRLQEPVTRAGAAFTVADRDLSSQDLDGVHEPVASRLRSLESDVATADRRLRAADLALRLLPGMLGADGPRNYLLVVQNNAEVRSTGGLAGANLVLHTDDGRVTITRQVPGRSFLQTKQPVLPLTSAEQKIYGPTLGEFYSAAGFTPDFPRAAALWKARWEQVYPDDHLDGVLAIDPVAASYLLAATGPVKVDGDIFSDIDVVPKLLGETYYKYPVSADQDSHFQRVANALVARFTTDPGNPVTLLDGLGKAVHEGRLLFASFVPDEQHALEGSTIGGALVTDPSAPPQLGVYFNDTTGSKMSYFLRTKVGATSTGCQNGAQQLSGSVRLTSTAPTDVSSLPPAVTGGGTQGITPGDQLVTVRIFGPIGGTLKGFVLDGKPLKGLGTIDQDGRPVASVYAELVPQASSSLTWTMSTGPQQTAPVELAVTPGIEPGSQSATIPSVC